MSVVIFFFTFSHSNTSITFFFCHPQENLLLLLRKVDNPKGVYNPIFMEQQNHTTDTDQFLILGPTPNEPHTPMAHVNVADTNNNVVGGAVNVGIGSGSAHVVAVAKSETVGSGQAVKRGRGRPRKYDAVGSAVLPATTGPPGFSDQTVKRGRGRPRGSGKLQILASIGEFSRVLFVFCVFLFLFCYESLPNH